MAVNIKKINLTRKITYNNKMYLNGCIMSGADMHVTYATLDFVSYKRFNFNFILYFYFGCMFVER